MHHITPQRIVFPELATTTEVKLRHRIRIPIAALYFYVLPQFHPIHNGALLLRSSLVNRIANPLVSYF